MRTVECPKTDASQEMLAASSHHIFSLRHSIQSIAMAPERLRTLEFSSRSTLLARDRMADRKHALTSSPKVARSLQTLNFSQDGRGEKGKGDPKAHQHRIALSKRDSRHVLKQMQRRRSRIVVDRARYRFRIAGAHRTAVGRIRLHCWNLLVLGSHIVLDPFHGRR